VLGRAGDGHPDAQGRQPHHRAAQRHLARDHHGNRDLHVRAQRSQPADLHTGHATFWDGENVNSKTFTATFTGHVNVRGSDGSHLTNHFVAHVTINANGTATVEFETERLSCP
jgi:hypothetical protein